MAGKKQELASVKKGPSQEVVSREEYARRVEEIKRCREDICYFAENYFRIVTLDNGLQLIKLYPKQKEMLRMMVNEKRLVALASRQSGKSTAYNVFVLWYCMFHSAKAVMMCAQREATAVELLSRIRMAYEYIPEWIKPSVVEYNKKSIEFGNMSSIKVFATKGGGARGNTANVLVLDEFAFVPPNEANEFFASVYPVISSGKNSKVIIVSTPNGAQGLYYDIWTQANLNTMDPEKNAEGWKPIRIDWFEVPGRDEKWKKQQIASVGIEKWEQEFECQFTSSSFQKLIPSELTDRYRKSYNKLVESS